MFSGNAETDISSALSFSKSRLQKLFHLVGTTPDSTSNSIDDRLDQYFMGYTMRFPRAIAIREDLGIGDCLPASGTKSLSRMDQYDCNPPALLESIRSEKKRKMEPDQYVLTSSLSRKGVTTLIEHLRKRGRRQQK